MLSLGTLFFVGFTLLLAILIAAYFFFKKEKKADHVDVNVKVSIIKEFLPLSRQKGWRISSVKHGLCVWEKEFHMPWASHPVQACSVIVPSSPKTVLEVLYSNSVRQEWDYSINGINNVTMTTAKYQGHMLTDVVSIEPSSKVFGWFGYLWSLITRKDHIVCSRFWHEEDDGQCWLLSMNIEQSVLMPEWTCFIIRSVPKSDGSNDYLGDQTQVTSLVISSFQWISFVDILTSRIIGIREYVINCRAKRRTKEDQREALEESINGEKKEIIEVQYTPSPAQQILLGKPVEDKSKRFFEEIQKGKEGLLKAYNAVADQDGWAFYQDYRGVQILKRAAIPGITAFDTYKGTSVVNVPAVYALKYVSSIEHRGHWDGDFNSGSEVEVIDDLTKIVHLKYKPVWPTTARDFCVVAKTFQTEDGLAAISTKTVLHPLCPDLKGYVRAEILTAGFVVKELTSDPPTCSVTYITQADFKGNLPIRLVNKVSSEQPQLVAVLRENVEALYKSDQMKEKNQDTPASFHKEADAFWAAMIAAYSQDNDGSSTDDMRDSLSDISSLSEDQKKMENGEVENEESSEAMPVSDALQLPMADRFTVDFRTLGNQAAAGLLGELLLATKVDIDSESKQLGSEEKLGEWTYQGMEKDVVIMKKIFEDQPFHCFLGKGMISESPLAVWEIIRDHNSRYQYDRMLKKSKIIKQIDEQTKILYMHHETTQCFVKQARDFVVLTSERIENNKYVIAAVSVDIPECPPQKNLIRSNVIASGWVIEPVLQNGQLCSMVSYLSQVDFGGNVPVRLLNIVARRQPLCIAYLRGYLEKCKEAHFS